jgi:hypothetical protein
MSPPSSQATGVGISWPVGTLAALSLSITQEIKLGEHILRDSELLDMLSWDRFVVLERGKPDLMIWGPLCTRPASHLLGCLQWAAPQSFSILLLGLGSTRPSPWSKDPTSQPTSLPNS